MNEDLFKTNGGNFIIPPAQLQDKLRNVKALVFDWDGVFNSGEKGALPSSFSEVDSMGINMLRFGYFMLSGQIPYTAIVTGETNPAGFKCANRERFDQVFFQTKHKVELLPILKKDHGIEPDEVLFVFDDILDLSLAEQVGARFLVFRKSNPLFNAFCIKHGICDYQTYSSGNEGALREVSEVVLDALGLFDKTIEERIQFDGIYQDFLNEKMSKKTRFLKSENQMFISKELEELL